MWSWAALYKLVIHMQLMDCWLETHGVKQSHTNHDYPFVSSFISHGVWFYLSTFIFITSRTMENMVISTFSEVRAVLTCRINFPASAFLLWCVSFLILLCIYIHINFKNAITYKKRCLCLVNEHVT